MTHNNISFLELLERKRSNLASEKETHRSNLAKEENTIAVAGIEDLAKRDVAAQDVEARLLIAGLNREAQQAVAQIQAGASAYSARTNADIQRYIADINAAVRREELGETSRHNLVQEDIGQTQNSIASVRDERNYELGLGNLEVSKGHLAETQTHDSAMEILEQQRIGANFTSGIVGNALRMLPGVLGIG